MSLSQWPSSTAKQFPDTLFIFRPCIWGHAYEGMHMRACIGMRMRAMMAKAKFHLAINPRSLFAIYLGNIEMNLWRVSKDANAWIFKLSWQISSKSSLALNTFQIPRRSLLNYVLKFWCLFVICLRTPTEADNTSTYLLLLRRDHTYTYLSLLKRDHKRHY